MNRRMCRQVLDCGDGVREVTALAVKLLKIPNRAADTATTTQSGDSEDSVAAVQDAGATNPPPCGSFQMRGQKKMESFTFPPRTRPDKKSLCTIMGSPHCAVSRVSNNWKA